MLADTLAPISEEQLATRSVAELQQLQAKLHEKLTLVNTVLSSRPTPTTLPSATISYPTSTLPSTTISYPTATLPSTLPYPISTTSSSYPAAATSSAIPFFALPPAALAPSAFVPPTFAPFVPVALPPTGISTAATPSTTSVAPTVTLPGGAGVSFYNLSREERYARLGIDQTKLANSKGRSGYNISDLRYFLQKIGKSTKGSKADLVQRLTDYFAPH